MSSTYSQYVLLMLMTMKQRSLYLLRPPPYPWTHPSLLIHLPVHSSVALDLGQSCVTRQQVEENESGQYHNKTLQVTWGQAQHYWLCLAFEETVPIMQKRIEDCGGVVTDKTDLVFQPACFPDMPYI